jgi:hypothetical protein
MPAMGALFVALAAAVRVYAQNVLGNADDAAVASAFEEVGVRRQRPAQGAYRRAKIALEHDDAPGGPEEREWLGFAAMLVQVDRIVADLREPLPA